MPSASLKQYLEVAGNYVWCAFTKALEEDYNYAKLGRKHILSLLKKDYEVEISVEDGCGDKEWWSCFESSNSKNKLGIENPNGEEMSVVFKKKL